MAIDPGKGRQPLQPISLETSESSSSASESTLARQVQTEGGLLSQVQSKSRFAGIPLLGWIEARFVRKEVKTKYVATLKEQFIGEATIHGWPLDKVQAVFTHFIQPKLMKTNLEELPHLEAFWALPHGIETFMLVATMFPQDAAKGVKTLTQMVDTAIKAMKNNPQGTQKVLANSAQVTFMMTGRFIGPDPVEYVDTMLGLVGRVKPDDFNTRVLKPIDDFLQEATRIQAERPRVYIATDQQQLVELFYANDFHAVRKQLPFLGIVYDEILDMTVVMNTQALHENIAMFYKPISIDRRTFPSLETRYAHSPITTSRERHVPFQLLEDSDQLIDFAATTDLYITNEKTMETRCLRIPLPFEGKMTQTEARRLLELLDQTIAGPASFDKHYRALELSPELQGVRKEKFLTWVAAIEQEYGKLICDFNPTPKRPSMSYALETETSKAALINPQSRRAATEMVRAKNVYRVDGRLSLLPAQIAAQHPELAMVASDEFQQAADLLRGKRKMAVPMKIAPGLTADVNLRTEKTKNDGNDVIQIQTTFRAGNNTYTRTTFFMLRSKQKPAQKLEEIIRSGLLERDLLLAKAEFIERVQ